MAKSLLNFFIFLVCCIFPEIAKGNFPRLVSTQDGLSSRYVFDITKGKVGYVWVLTFAGVDRYNGSDITQYALKRDDERINIDRWRNFLAVDRDGEVWVYGLDGNVFRYNRDQDEFEAIDLLQAQEGFTVAKFDQNDYIWFGRPHEIVRYNIHTGEYFVYSIDKNERPTGFELLNDSTAVIGFDDGLYYFSMNYANGDFSLTRFADAPLNLYRLIYNKESDRLIVSTQRKGIYLYDFQLNEMYHLGGRMHTDITVERIVKDKTNPYEYYIATTNAGVLKLNLVTKEITTKLSARNDESGYIQGNTISALYIDERERFWLGMFGLGLAVYSPNNPFCKWYKPQIGPSKTLINNQVTYLLEDSDGDVWFATSNGISVLNRSHESWTTFLENTSGLESSVFTSLFEVEKGTILAFGYDLGIYVIEKKSGAVSRLYNDKSRLVSDKTLADITPIRYIRSIYKEPDGTFWVGGYFGLVHIDWTKKSCQYYGESDRIRAIETKDEHTLWLGTTTGLFLFDKESGQVTEVKFPSISKYVTSLYQNEKGDLYVGTNGGGLLVYYPEHQTFTSLSKQNSKLLSDYIYAIQSDDRGNILLSAENSLIQLSENGIIRNWTEDQGLPTSNFSFGCGIHTRDNRFIFGTSNGAIEFPDTISFPSPGSTRITFERLKVGGSRMAISPTSDFLKLQYDQNSFSLRFGVLNFSTPNNIKFSWRLLGVHKYWRVHEQDREVQYSNLWPGSYTLQVRAHSRADGAVLDLKELSIVVMPAWWNSWQAPLCYALLVCLLLLGLLRHFWLRKEYQTNSERVKLFLQLVHDIRTPLSMVRSPLNNLSENEILSKEGKEQLLTAQQGVNDLIAFTSNLLRLQGRPNIRLALRKIEINQYVQLILDAYSSWAGEKSIELKLLATDEPLYVWADLVKLESILQNIISNALKYTPPYGKVTVRLWAQRKGWYLEVADTGIGIPEKEQKNIFSLHFKASNVYNHLTINNEATLGLGVGLSIVKGLIKQHQGRIHFYSKEGEGTIFTISFPLGLSVFKRDSYDTVEAELKPNEPLSSQHETSKTTLLVVDDNENLRRYLQNELQSDYNVYTAANGVEALALVHQVSPQLVVTDLMMPLMKGDELCSQLKTNVETSHIMVILLSGLSDGETIAGALEKRADSYMVKPFDMKVLRATIHGLLENRAQLHTHYLENRAQEKPETPSFANKLDEEFMENIKSIVLANLTNSDFSIDQLCERLYMSRTSLFNKVKALSGQAPAEFVRIIRLNQASHLLSNSKQSISEIAYNCGFSDPKYFRQVFKKHFGVSPTEYARGVH